MVNVGLPAIGRSLSANASALQWVVNAYLLPLSALLLAGVEGRARPGYGHPVNWPSSIQTSYAAPCATTCHCKP